MVSSRLLSCLFFLLILTLISHQGTNAQPNFLKFYCGGNQTANVSSTTTYQNNLKTLLLSLSTNTQIDYGFYNFSYGENSDRVNAIALCRGDVRTPEDCRSCLSDSRVLLPQVCPNVTEAIGWYDNCLLRYTNRTIFNAMETSPFFYLWNTEDALEVEAFKNVRSELMDRLRITAASGNSLRKYAAANASGPSNQTIYGLAQCTPDLSNDDCNVCLGGAISEIPKCCNGNKGGRVVRPSCNIRYESYSFFETGNDTQPLLPSPLSPLPPLSPPRSPSPPLLPPPSLPEQGKRNTSRIVIAIVVPTVAFMAVLILIFVICFKARKQRNQIESAGESKDIITADSLQMDFETIRVATNDFSNANKLGEGGFGPVYMGRLYNGQEIAVKRLSRDSGQGDMEFKNEVLLMAELQHRNLVKLLGFCLENGERILVYELVSNKSLDYFIFDPTRQAEFDWKTRYKVIEGIARGLLYLHHDSQVRIIHRDLKPSNILLDEEMNPKISDFGMARLFVVDQTQDRTSTVVGTYGYLAPEYMKRGVFSIKSDVFSFGVLVLEIVCGRKNGESHDGENVEHLVSVAWKNWKERTLSNIVDPMLVGGDDCSKYEIMRCIHIGLLCAQENESVRPTMASIVPMLNSYSFSLPIPLEPAFYMWKSFPTMEPFQSAEGSINEASITEQYPR